MNTEKKKSRPVEGQTVWLLKRRNVQELCKSTVSKVGVKYFCLEGSLTRYRLSDWQEETEYARDVVFETEGEYQECIDRLSMLRTLRETFNKWSNPNLTLENLRAIKAIIERPQ